MQNKIGSGRVLLAMDISPRSKAALKTAVSLAAELDAELVGLFVEDVNLLHLGGLPFAREIGFFPAGSHPIGPEDIEQALQREAGEVQHQLAEAAGRLRLRWSFHVARGQVASELFALASELDLVVLGKQARFGMRLLNDFVLQGEGASGPVAVVFDGSPAACRSLELAHRLSVANGAELRVLVPADTRDEFLRYAGEAQALLGRGPIPVCKHIVSAEAPELVRAVRDWHAGVLVLNGDGHFRSSEGFSALLDEIDCPVVLVG